MLSHANHCWTNWRAHFPRKRPYCRMCCRFSGHPSRIAPCSCSVCHSCCRCHFGQHFYHKIRLKWGPFYRRLWPRFINSEFLFGSCQSTEPIVWRIAILYCLFVFFLSLQLQLYGKATHNDQSAIGWRWLVTGCCFETLCRFAGCSTTRLG